VRSFPIALCRWSHRLGGGGVEVPAPAACAVTALPALPHAYGTILPTTISPFNLDTVCSATCEATDSGR